MRWHNKWPRPVRPRRAATLVRESFLAPRTIRFLAVMCAASTVGSLLLTQAARAGERQFLVILATSPKQFGGGQPPGGLLNPELIRKQYFDFINPSIDSFAEYWEEISYGDVRISGDVTEWINLPWAITGDPPPSLAAGENFNSNNAMVRIDLNGDPGGIDDGPVILGPGSGDTVWMPGERFVDMDGDGKWDGLDEANNVMDFFPLPSGDGQPDLLGPWFDLNQNNQGDNPVGCVYLPDSDNDRNPNCCPNGPGLLGTGCDPFPAPGACPATQWNGPNGMITDCNGNLIPDACDVSPVNMPSAACVATGWLAFDPNCALCGVSMDRLPLSEGDDPATPAVEVCGAPTMDGIPDECRLVNFNVDCIAMPADPMSPCVNMQVCQPLANPRDDAIVDRCEFDDGNTNGVLDIVEPFENFLRRWDVNTGQWIMVSAQYIQDNYPGNVGLVLSQTQTRALMGDHDPLLKLGGGPMPSPAGQHAQFDPPDFWFEAGNAKMNNLDDDGVGPAFIGPITPLPPWFQQAWVDWFGTIPPPWGTCDTGVNLGQLCGIANDCPGGQCIGATPRMVRLDDTLRRTFVASHGGTNGDGTGFLGQQVASSPILPEEMKGIGQPLTLYDGPPEFADLPSSKYHRIGDGRLGEATSPFSENIWGEDRGDNDPGTTAGPDGIIEPAGPYATGIHGNFGRDAGNVLHMELLTFGQRDATLDGLVDGSTAPTPTPIPISYLLGGGGRNRLVEDCIEIIDDVLDFDDFVDSVALDRINCVRDSLQQGQLLTNVPPALRGGEGQPVLPGQEPVVPPVIAKGVLSGTVLLPQGVPPLDELDTTPSFFAIHNEDGLGDAAFEDANLPRVDSPSPPGFVPTIPFEPQISWNIFFHNWVRPLDGALAGGDPGTTVEDFQVRHSAQAYLVSWEGFPFLFDFDILDAGAIENCPIGVWDIMANGGLVHPVPILKEKVCTEWIKPVDLTTVVTPGVDAVLTLPPAEFVRDESYFFLENEKRPGERYYFWSAGVEGSFDEPRPSAGMPAEGMLVMHTDVGPDGTFSNLDALSQQQRSGTRPAFLIVQADGLGELQACSDVTTGVDERGDDGDPFPGITGATRFNFNTVPAATWFTQNSWTGIDVLDVEPDESGSVKLTINWVPTTIPSLRFVDPPGGQSVGNNFQVRFEATDVFGGTTIRLFFTKDEKTCSGSGAACTKNSDCPAGQLCQHNTTIGSAGVTFIDEARKTTPGTNQLSKAWNIAGIADGRYVLFAKLNPGQGADGTEDKNTTPRAGRNNVGNGSLVVTAVDIDDDNVDTDDTARFETWTAECIDPDCDDWLVSSSLSQPPPAEGTAPPNAALAHPGVAYPSIGGEVTFTITQGSVDFALGDTFTFTTTGITAVSQAVTIEGGRITEGPIAVITAMTPESGPLSGPPPLEVTFDGRNSIDPNGEPLDCLWDFGDGSPTTTGCLVTHTYNEAGVFTATLRVTNPLSGRFGETTVDINVINNSPNAAFIATPTSGPTPLQVQFDASQSSDTETPEDELIYQWNFGDGTAANDQGLPGILIETEHTYRNQADGTPCTAQNPCTFNATLTVTDELGKEDTDTVKILVGNTRPVAAFTASPQQGPAPLPVVFDASSSSDADDDNLTVTWNFGDGTALVERSLTGNNAMPVITHTYAAIGTFLPTATVRDGVNRGQAIAGSVTIEVTGNQSPTADFLASPTTGITEATEFRFDGRASDDEDGEIVSFAWDFDDGQTATGSVVTHTYDIPDSYNVRLTVTDDRGASDSRTRVVVVEVNPGNQPPVAHIPTLPSSCTAPCLLNLDGTLSFDPDDDVSELQFTWEVSFNGQLVTLSGSKTNVVLDLPGLYEIVLVVSDGRGGVDSAGPVTVLATAPGAFPTDPPPGGPVPGDGGDIPDSSLQRPSRVCGFGMLMSLFGSLLGLSMMAATRRGLRL